MEVVGRFFVTIVFSSWMCQANILQSVARIAVLCTELVFKPIVGCTEFFSTACKHPMAHCFVDRYLLRLELFFCYYFVRSGIFCWLGYHLYYQYVLVKGGLQWCGTPRAFLLLRLSVVRQPFVVKIGCFTFVLSVCFIMFWASPEFRLLQHKSISNYYILKQGGRHTALFFRSRWIYCVVRAQVWLNFLYVAMFCLQFCLFVFLFIAYSFYLYGP